MPTFSSIATHPAIIERLLQSQQQQPQQQPQQQQQHTSPHNTNATTMAVAAPPKNPLALLGQTPQALQTHLGVQDMELVQTLRLQMAHAMLLDQNNDDAPTTASVFSGLPTVRLDQALQHHHRRLMVPDLSLGDDALNDLVRFPDAWTTTTTYYTSTASSTIIIPPGHLTCLQGPSSSSSSHTTTSSNTGKTQLALQIAIEMALRLLAATTTPDHSNPNTTDRSSGGRCVVRYCVSSAGGASLFEIATRLRSMSEAARTQGDTPNSSTTTTTTRPSSTDPILLQPLSSLSELWLTLAAAEDAATKDNHDTTTTTTTPTTALWIIDSIDTLCQMDGGSNSHGTLEQVLTKLKDWVRRYQIHMVVILSEDTTTAAAAATHTCDVCLELSHHHYSTPPRQPTTNVDKDNHKDDTIMEDRTPILMARVLHHVGRIELQQPPPPPQVVALQLTRRGLVAVDSSGSIRS